MATAPVIDTTDEPEQTPPHVEILTAVDADPSCVLLGRYTVDQLVEAILVDIADHKHNPDTEAGRKGIASDAYTVSKRKAAIDKKRLEMTAEWRKLTAETNETGKAITEKLQALAVEIRAPVTAWEKAEDKRKLEADAIIADLTGAPIVTLGMTSDDVEQRLERIRGMNLNGDVLGVRIEMATDLRDTAVAKLTEHLVFMRQQEAQAAELEQLRRERAEAEARAEREAAERLAEQQRQEREKAEQERIAQAAQEAADKARREAEQAAEQARRDAEEAAERKRQEEAAAARAAEEERQRQAQAEIDAANRRAAEAEAAAKAERDRIAAEQRAREEAEAAEAEAQRKRDADLAHRQQVIDAAAEKLTELGLSKKLATSIIHAIEAGKVPAVSIKF